MSGWRKTDNKPGVVLTLWRPLPDDGGGDGDGDQHEGEPRGEAPPAWCMGQDCRRPLGSRFVERQVRGWDLASCAPPGRGAAHTWLIRRIFLCQDCYLAALERELGAGWPQETGARPDARKTGRWRGDWDD